MQGKAHHTRILFRAVALCLLSSCLAHGLSRVPAQNKRGQKGQRPEARGAGTRSRDAAEGRATKGTRLAVEALVEAADAAHKFEDLFDGARIQALAADALWDADEQTARAILRRAWNDATSADAEELSAAREAGDNSGAHYFTDARDAVINSAGKHDPRLAEKFFREMMDALRESGFDTRRAARDAYSAGPSEGLSVEAWQRLEHAEKLLDAGEPARAAALAAHAVAEGPGINLLSFLLRLRAQSPKDADALYARLLEATRADPSSDANDALLLSSYILTPDQLLTVDEFGSVDYTTIHGLRPPDAGAQLSTRLRAAFFNTAAAILLRPLPATTGATTDPRRRNDALFFALGRLIPFFEREAPQHAPALHARLSALSADIDAERREDLESEMEVRRLMAENPTDPLRPYLEQIKNAREPEARDTARRLAVQAATRRKMWDRAKRLTDEMESQEAREASRFLIAAWQVAALAETLSDGDAEDVEPAVAFVRQAGLSPHVSAALRAYGLATTAGLAARVGLKARAEELLSEAGAEARQATKGTEAAAAAALMNATVAFRLGSPRAWELLTEVVAALNDDAEFAGDDFRFESDAVKLYPGEQDALRAAFGSFRLETLFAEAAAKNFERTLTEAHAMKGETARALALVAASRRALAPRVRKPAEKK